MANIEPFDPTRKKKKKKKIDNAVDGSEKPALGDGIYAREKLEDLMERGQWSWSGSTYLFIFRA